MCIRDRYELLQEYFDSGKPAIALRTTSHGMWPMDKKDWFVPFFGGHYKGHAGNEEGTTTIVDGDQLDHPILRGVPKFRFWNDRAGRCLFRRYKHASNCCFRWRLVCD